MWGIIDIIILGFILLSVIGGYKKIKENKT